MRIARWVTIFLLVGGLAGCGSGEDESPKMPDVTGRQLDVAKSDIARAGFDLEIEVLGGGTFGIVDETNWLVCEQLPAKGEPIGDSPRLTVDRSCDDEEDSDAAVPAETPSTETTSPATTVPVTSPATTVPATTSPATTIPATTSPDTSVPSVEEMLAELEGAPAGIDAQAMEAAYVSGLAGPISGMCASAREDPTWTSGPHWACFNDGVEAAPSYLRVNLTTDGGYAPGELVEMANDTGRGWFNFIACEFRDLDMIVVTINGLDHNVPRSSTKADLLCN